MEKIIAINSTILSLLPFDNWRFLLYLLALLFYIDIFLIIWAPKSKWCQQALMNPVLRTVLFLGFGSIIMPFPPFRRILLHRYLSSVYKDLIGRLPQFSITHPRIIGLKKPSDIFIDKRLVQLLGPGGIGKTTFMQSIAVMLTYRGSVSQRDKLPGKPIPIFIRASSNISLMEQIEKNFSDQGMITDRKLSRRFREQAGLVVLVDDIDELEYHDRENTIREIFSLAKNNWVCVASRLRLRELSDVPVVTLKPFDLDQLKGFLHHRIGYRADEILPSIDDDLYELLGNPSIAEAIVSVLEVRKLPGPLNLSSLMEAYFQELNHQWYEEDHPEYSTSLFRAAFRATLKRVSSLDISDRLLPPQVTEDLLARGIAVRYGNKVQFAHRLFQEYLTAKALVVDWKQSWPVLREDLDTSHAQVLKLAIIYLNEVDASELIRVVFTIDPKTANDLVKSYEKLHDDVKLDPKGKTAKLANQLRESTRKPETESQWNAWLMQKKPDPDSVDLLPRQGQGWPAIRLRRLLLHNIKCFEKLDLDLRSWSDERRKTVAIVGDNSTGKSTILQAIALACLGSASTQKLGKFNPRKMLRHGADEGIIEVELEFAPFQNEKYTINVGLGLQAKDEGFSEIGDREMISSFQNHAHHVNALRRRVDFQWGLCCGYGAFRAVKPSDQVSSNIMAQKAASDRVMSLFTRSESLFDPETLNALLYGGSSIDSVTPKLTENARLDIMEMLSSAIPGLKVDLNEDKQRLVESFNDVTDITQLSDGCNSMAALLTHLTWHTLNASSWQGTPFESRGIVLIDELDLHLHPTWQRHALDHLTKTFPNIQFIVTTHSPQVLGGVPDGQIEVLRRNRNSRIELADDVPSVQGWRIDQILTGIHFNVPSVYDLETEALRSEYARLVNEPVPDEKRVSELEGKLHRMIKSAQPTPAQKQAWRLFLKFVEKRLDESSISQRDRLDVMKSLVEMFAPRGVRL